MKVMRDIAHGMAAIHDANIIHRDLKPDNVLMKSPLDVSNTSLCKITDFGTSRTAENVFAITMTKGQGTPLYMAPEILAGHKRYSKPVDVYSFGILCCVIVNDGREPYSEYNFPNPLEMQNAILSGCRPQLSPNTPLSPLIHKCWSMNVNDRPPFDQIVNSFG